ncbi:MAG: glycosyltransferase family 8 protein, partial [Butyrivibrio sp.]|nr:glycosyltransferase family 8 protein [Butyrivibrio sp.]
MNIAYASDDNFVDVMLVSIMSFNDHNSNATIYILDCGIEEHDKQKILELCSDKNTVLFVDAKEMLKLLPYDLNLDRGSVAAYARLFIGSMLPDTVSKVLYLDCDTLVLGALDELFNTEMDQYVIGGVRDAFSVLNKKVFGIQRGKLLINSGVLLIDLQKWRLEKKEELINQLICSNKKIYQGDQGVINMVFHGNVYELPLKYDVMTYLFDFSYEEMMLYRKPDNYFTKKEVRQAVDSPVIVHFSSSFCSYRPWEKVGNLDHPYYFKWNAYFQQIGTVKKERVCQKVKIRGTVLLFVRLLHAYIRPLFSIFMIK